MRQEFSIEIPDKEADAIHSGRFPNAGSWSCILMISQSSKQWSTSWLSPMVSRHLKSRRYSKLTICSSLDDIGEPCWIGDDGCGIGSRFYRHHYIYASV
jgi:hypothetical protein